MVTMETTFTKENMLIASKRVAKKKSAGVDNISAKDIESIVDHHHKVIFKELLSNTYNPKSVLIYHIPKPNGKYRPIGVATALDRVIQATINDSIYPLFEGDISEHSHGFRKNHNCETAINEVVNYINDGYCWISKIDLSGCFNHLNHDRIIYRLRKKIDDERLIQLIIKYLKVTVLENRLSYKNYDGCVQGCSIAPLLSGLILCDVDSLLEERQVKFVRYADDIFILSKSYKSAQRVTNSSIAFIENKCKLPVNHDKTSICNINDGFTALGFYMYSNNGHIHVIPANSNLLELKTNIRNICMHTNKEYLINRLNEVLRGWLSYYLSAEIAGCCRRLDLFLNKELNKADKRCGIKIDRTNLINCHEFYQNRVHLFTGIDGKQKGKTTDIHERDTAADVSWCRDPPIPIKMA